MGDATERERALERAVAFSSFLREAARARPDIVKSFVDEGIADAIAAALAIEAELA
jgi:hypothetical protein